MPRTPWDAAAGGGLEEDSVRDALPRWSGGAGGSGGESVCSTAYQVDAPDSINPEPFAVIQRAVRTFAAPLIAASKGRTDQVPV